MKRIVANEQYCIGCRLCEVHCLVAHSGVGRSRLSSLARRIIKAYKDESPRAEPRLLVEEQGHVSFAVQCRHCDDAPCLDACISGAMHRTEEGTVLCDEDRCVGCWMCVMVCPYGVIHCRREEAAKADSAKAALAATAGQGAPQGAERRRPLRKIASKCDFCAGEATPACVLNCPNEALSLVEE
jgi:carbon-monoxide dehydrogenase iron sulfur subunit